MGVGCGGVGMEGEKISVGGGGEYWSKADDKSKVNSHYGRATFFPETAQQHGITEELRNKLEKLAESDHEDSPLFSHAKCMSCAEDIVNADGKVREGCNNLGSLFVDSIFALAESFSDLVINSYEQDDGSVLFMLVEDTSVKVNDFEIELQSSSSVMDVTVVDGGLLVSPRMFGVECGLCGYENIVQRDQEVNLSKCKVTRLEAQSQLDQIIDSDDGKSLGGDYYGKGLLSLEGGRNHFKSLYSDDLTVPEDKDGEDDYDDESFNIGNSVFSGVRYDPDYYLSQNGDSE